MSKLVDAFKTCTKDEAGAILQSFADAGKMTWRDAVEIYYDFFLKGWLELAFRAKAIGAGLVIAGTSSSSPPDQRASLLLAKALTFHKRYDEALAAASAILTDDSTPKMQAAVSSLRQYLSIYLEKPLPDVSASERYRELVQGKSVAVIGPGASAEQSGAEIDSFDIVVRPNVLDQAIFNPETSGSRTDVSYYNGFCERAKRKEIMAFVAKGTLKHLVHGKKIKRVNAKQYRKVVPYHICRKTPILFGSQWNLLGMQRIISDLLPYKPAKIKLFKTDFYTSPILYAEGYQIRPTRLLDDLSKHDAVENFRFSKKLLNLGLIQGDAAVEKILAADEEQYVHTVDQVFSGPPA